MLLLRVADHGQGHYGSGLLQGRVKDPCVIKCVFFHKTFRDDNYVEVLKSQKLKIW